MRKIQVGVEETQSFGLPWKYDAPCFNFEFPKEFIKADNLEELGDKSDIKTLVITCDLPDYGFIADMENLTHLYIYSGNNISNMRFIEKLYKLRQLLLYGTHISALDSLTKLLEEKTKRFKAETEPINRLDWLLDVACVKSDCFDCDLQTLKDMMKPYVSPSEIIINSRSLRR